MINFFPFKKTGGTDLTQSEIQEAVNSANSLAMAHKQSRFNFSALNM